MTAVSTTPGWTRIRIAVAVVAMAVLASLLAIAPTPEEPVAEAAGPHPYSDPVWYPLRYSKLTQIANVPKWSKTGPFSSLVGCVYSNCDFKAHKTPDDPNGPHGDWAIDFTGDLSDNVYAAGSGIFHIGYDRDGCDDRKGRWAWIDHGGGVVSRYHHLDDILLRDGTKVTPTTHIAEMGHTGAHCVDSVNYLHFEVRKDGVLGKKYDFGNLKACHHRTGVPLVFPRDINVASPTWDPATVVWNDIDWRSEEGAIPRTSSDCIPAGFKTPDQAEWTRGKFGSRKATIWWPKPNRVSNRVTVAMQMWRPTLSKFSEPHYFRFAGDVRQATFREFLGERLVNGRPYRFRIAYHNKLGNSAWGPARVVKPGAPPDAPVKKRITATSSRINLGWYRAGNNGYDVTGHVVAIRKLTSSGWTDWVETRKRLGEGYSHNWFNLASRRTYGVRVRARSSIGPGPWSDTYKITTTR